MTVEAAYQDIFLDCILGADASSAMPSSVWIALLSPDAVECTGTDYARVEVANDGTSFPAASSAAKWLAIDVEFPVVGDSDWGIIGLAGVYDASTAGNRIALGRIGGGVIGPIPVGVTPHIAAGTLTLYYWNGN